VDSNQTLVAFRLTKEELAKLDDMARRTDRNRSQMLRWLIKLAAIEPEPIIVVDIKEEVVG